MLKAYEEKRGCGYREVNKLYLVSDGPGIVCPSLPLMFKPCPSCGYEPPQYRDFQWILKAYIQEIREPTGKACEPTCPICYPSQNTQVRYGLQWVGARYYTPEEFMKEAHDMGVSKGIKQIPKDLVLGETWVLLAHPKACYDIAPNPDPEDEEKYIQVRTPGVFYGFIPQRVEVLVYESQATPEKLKELGDKGLTPVIIPDDGTLHKRKTRRRRAV